MGRCTSNGEGCRQSYPGSPWIWCMRCLQDEFSEKDAELAALRSVVDRLPKDKHGSGVAVGSWVERDDGAVGLVRCWEKGHQPTQDDNLVIDFCASCEWVKAGDLAGRYRVILDSTEAAAMAAMKQEADDGK